MLRKLLFRDWILNRKALFSNFGLFVAFQIYAVLRVDASREWLVFAAGWAALLAVVAFVKEDGSKAIAWSCTLPVTRGELVRARLVSAWVFVLAGLTAAMLLAAARPGSIVDLAIVFEPSTLLIGATAITVIIALMQPFTIRFGMLGVMIFLVGVQILGVLALTLGSWVRRQGGGPGGRSWTRCRRWPRAWPASGRHCPRTCSSSWWWWSLCWDDSNCLQSQAISG